MVIIGDVLVTKIIEKVIDVGFNYLAEQHARHTGMKDELQRLEDALPRIQAVVTAADNAVLAADSVDNPHLQAWLQQFKDALYEADDALDDLEYVRLQKQVEADDDRDEDRKKVRYLLSNSKQSIIKFRKRIFKSDPTLEKLRSAVKRLDEVAARVGDFVALVSSVQQSQYLQHQSRTMTSRETGPLVTESTVFGRNSEREELLHWLMKDQPDQDEQNNVSLYSVVGHGGMGKTTLAQLVYNDENVQKYFDLRMWVCVSTSFDVRRITAAMLESAMKEKPKIENLAALQEALKDKLMSSNKFLLVLDDVWNDENCSDWDRLLAPLRQGHKGSKILLTTRMDKVAKAAVRAMGGSTKESMQLNPIHGDDFFSLFNRCAFAGISSGDYKELQPLGMKIAQRLGGSPLAAKTIGALLNSNLDERYWTGILNCKNISDQGQQREGNIMSILMLSYHHLPLYLRPCFAFCSTFPQDYKFKKEDLVLSWMALGLIQHSPQNQGQTLEDIGSSYFDELLNRSFFEIEKGSSFYIMHDLLHDVARSVSHGECFSIVNDDKSVEDIPNTVRHLYLDIENLNIVMKVDKWQQLRSLHLSTSSCVAEVLEMVFKSLKCVRMLKVNVGGMGLRDVFGHLRHLRNLTIPNSIDKFPASLCKLHHLQVLEFHSQYSTVLPENMKNLISLRHLVTSICHVIARVRKLSSLQVLSISIKKERDYKINELEGLNMIRELRLQGLENVESPEEASMAKLGNKEYLRVLRLEWRPNNDTERNNPTMDEQQQILDCLQPHSSLKELRIEGYEGVRPAKWMDFELVNNLQRISLEHCSRLEHLPSFGKLPFLKYLTLWKMPLVKKLDCDCQQLENLHLRSMEGLEELSQSDENFGQWCPRLRELTIVNSPKLSVLPSLSFRKLPFLKYLSLGKMPLVKQLDCDCQQLEQLHLWSMEGLEELSQSDENSGQWCPRLCRLLIGNSPKLSVLPSLSPSLRLMMLGDVGLTALTKLLLGIEGSSSSSSSSLYQLTINGCQKLTSLDKGLLLQQQYLTTLETLQISHCDMLVDFPAGGLQHLRALRTLEIKHCPNLRLDPTMIDPAGNDENFLPSSLQDLSIGFCAELERSIPTPLKGALASLSSLSLEGMNFLPSSSVWRKLASLDYLRISNCEELMSLEVIYALQHLGCLAIHGCPRLVCTATTPLQTGLTLAIDKLEIDDPMLLLAESFRSLTSLRELHISNCSELESISGQMEEWLLQRRTTLNSLTIGKASSLKSLPDSLQTFSSLEKLILYEARQLQSVPRLPSSVGQLWIRGCNETLEDRCRKDEGADWPNINHIPYIFID